MDEKAIAKGHSSLTLVYSIEGASVEYIADGRTQASLDPYFESFSEEEREGIRAVVMDTWPANPTPSKLIWSIRIKDRLRPTSRRPSSPTAEGYSFTQLPTRKPDDPELES